MKIVSLTAAIEAAMLPGRTAEAVEVPDEISPEQMFGAPAAADVPWLVVDTDGHAVGVASPDGVELGGRAVLDTVGPALTGVPQHYADLVVDVLGLEELQDA